ncbi:MAG: histidine kinase dimerization/phospho-acceptor domain-containing protein [Gemmatimonadaceae bacterium]
MKHHELHSNRRLAFVAATVLATAGVLALVTLEARRAEKALESATAHTLRDYTGYAGRMMGAEVLRRFSEQRAAILAPVTGSSGRDVAAPSLGEVVQRGDEYFASFPAAPDSGLGYFRVDVRTGAIEGRGAVRDSLAAAIADTLRKLGPVAPRSNPTDILVVIQRGTPYSVAFARLFDRTGTATSVYGFTYTRSAGVAAIAGRVFRETPLLPTSFAGARWNYDTTQVRPGEVANDSLLAMRITDRAGHVLWQSAGGTFNASANGERVVLSTAAGGFDVESFIKAAGEPTLIPSIVRRAQSWSLRGLLVLTLLLVGVSLVALRRERLGARDRRTQAMQQLALGLRHEMNNALASVMLNAELLAEEESLDDDQRERLKAIVEQSDRMRAVLRRLEKTDHFHVVVPYLNEGYMVDLSLSETNAS